MISVISITILNGDNRDQKARSFDTAGLGTV